VVTGRAAGSKGVAEPEAVLGRDGVGDVGEGGSALVGRHHQVGVVAVAAQHLRRRGDAPADDVVGEVKQAADEGLIAATTSACTSSRVPPAGSRLGTKPPLAPTGTITVFLTFCAFIRPRTSVRKSSRRSDQRMPPRATCPMRRCTPSTRGE